MARRTLEDADSDLYERDYHAWVRRQVELLRAGRLHDLDLANLIEEVEDLGRGERFVVESHVETVLRHLLKLACSPRMRPRRGWAVTVRSHRNLAARRMTPSLHRKVEEGFARLYADARARAVLDLDEDEVAPEALPEQCPWSVEQVLDPAWLPGNIHGLEGGG